MGRRLEVEVLRAEREGGAADLAIDEGGRAQCRREKRRTTGDEQILSLDEVVDEVLEGRLGETLDFDRFAAADVALGLLLVRESVGVDALVSGVHPGGREGVS